MKTKLALDKNEKTFELLGEYIPGYNKNRALNGIGLKLKTEDECIKYTAELNVALAKAELEYEKNKKLEDIFFTAIVSHEKDYGYEDKVLVGSFKDNEITIIEEVPSEQPALKKRKNK